MLDSCESFLVCGHQYSKHDTSPDTSQYRRWFPAETSDIRKYRLHFNRIICIVTKNLSRSLINRFASNSRSTLESCLNLGDLNNQFKWNTKMYQLFCTISRWLATRNFHHHNLKGFQSMDILFGTYTIRKRDALFLMRYIKSEAAPHCSNATMSRLVHIKHLWKLQQRYTYINRLHQLLCVPYRRYVCKLCVKTRFSIYLTEISTVKRHLSINLNKCEWNSAASWNSCSTNVFSRKKILGEL